MSRKLSILLDAAALSLSGGLVHAEDIASPPTPASVTDSTPWLIYGDETGPVAHESPSAAPATGATRGFAALRAAVFHAPGSYAVLAPSSVNDATPWLINRQPAPIVFAR